MQYIAVDIACKETNSDKCAPQKSANYIDAPSSLPVMCAKTAFCLYSLTPILDKGFLLRWIHNENLL